MINKKSTLFIAMCLTFAILFAADTSMGQSHEEAIPIGGKVKTQINCSKRAGGIEVYDATITLLEVVRGSKAWEPIKKADSSNKKPDEGYEYILALISYKMIARGAPGDKTFDLDSPLQFSAFSNDFEEYETPEVVIPEPMLRRTVSADQYAEGWVALSVNKEDVKPLLMFDPSSGGAWSRGKISFFKLYE